MAAIYNEEHRRIASAKIVETAQKILAGDLGVVAGANSHCRVCWLRHDDFDRSRVVQSYFTVAVAQLDSLGIMPTSTTQPHRTFLYVLFWLFEALLVTSVIVLAFTEDRHRVSPLSDAAGLTFWFSFVGLFTVCFILRRVVRRLAVIGWLTLFGGFWFLAMMPAL